MIYAERRPRVTSLPITHVAGLSPLFDGGRHRAGRRKKEGWGDISAIAKEGIINLLPMTASVAMRDLNCIVDVERLRGW